MLRRIKVKMMSKGDPKILHDIFEKFDIKNQGVLSVGNFKSCFLQADLGFDMEDITRLSRYLDKERDEKINYAKFLKLVDDVFFDKHKLDDLDKFAKQIVLYLKSHHLTYLKFIKDIQETNQSETSEKNQSISDYKVSLRKFYRYASSLFLRSFKNPKKLYEFVNLMDIDQDGYIDPKDLEYFLKRHSFIQKA